MLITGSVQNAVKLAQLEEDWKRKKEVKKEQKKEEMTPQMRQLMQYQEEMEQIREGNQMASIDAKLKSGSELTPEEMAYLKEKNPEAYQEYEEVKREQEAYKNQLRNCKTKEEAERVKLSKMGNFMAGAKNISQNPNIPKEKKLKLMEKLLKKTIGVNQVHTEFVKSQEFRNLPTEEEKREEEKEKRKVVKGKQPDRKKEEELLEMDKKPLDKTNFYQEEETVDSAELEEEKKRKGKTKKGKNTAAAADFKETTTEILQFLTANRTIGGALEYRKIVGTEGNWNKNISVK